MCSLLWRRPVYCVLSATYAEASLDQAKERGQSHQLVRWKTTKPHIPFHQIQWPTFYSRSSAFLSPIQKLSNSACQCLYPQTWGVTKLSLMLLAESICITLGVINIKDTQQRIDLIKHIIYILPWISHHLLFSMTNVWWGMECKNDGPKDFLPW